MFDQVNTEWSRRRVRGGYRRRRAVRAFENKRGGWTLVSRDGQAFHLGNLAATHTWELLAGEGISLREIVVRLERLFPQVAPEILHRDVGAFLSQLEQHGFIEGVGPPNPRIS